MAHISANSIESAPLPVGSSYCRGPRHFFLVLHSVPSESRVWDSDWQDGWHIEKTRRLPHHLVPVSSVKYVLAKVVGE